MKKLFKKMTQNNKRSRDYVLCHPRNPIREDYLGSRPESFGLVSLGWDPSARPEADAPRCGQEIFHQKNTRDSGLHRNDKKKAFTLVETLVAISILMISVTGPLYHASEGLKAATYAKEQITAFYLAQDAFEQIVKLRNDNVYPVPTSGSQWYTGLTGCENTQCRVNTSGNFLDKSIPADNDYYLYLNPTTNIYSHNSDGNKTMYQRKVTIKPTDGDDDLWNNATEMKVTVKIEWVSRGVNRSFEAYEFLRAINI